MKTTDTSERGLEDLIVEDLTGHAAATASGAADATPRYGAGYVLGDARDFDRDHALDRVKLLSFLQTTQSTIFRQLDLGTDGPKRRQFLDRLQGEISRRGIVDVLRRGVKHGPAHVDLFYGAPSPGNVKAVERFTQNLFSVTRQLRFSKDETRRALDLCLFINGLPVATFELKNLLTKQTVHDAEEQYKADRDPRELIFHFGRCLAHFAVDDQEVRFCTELKGKDSGSSPSIRAGTTAPATRPTPMASRPTTCGAAS